MEQRIITIKDDYIELNQWVWENGIKKIFVVSSGSGWCQKITNTYIKKMEEIGVEMVAFHNFQPNPDYGSVVEGVKLFHEKKCDAIIAVGGGSAMDVAKCIKLYSNMDSTKNYLEQEIIPNDIPFLAMPTTAGTGSESTRFAVIYYKGRKQSVTSASCIPGTILLDPSCLKTLSLYQKKATCMDALCHAIESFWSVNSMEKSKKYSKSAIKSVMENLDGYLANTDEGNIGMLLAANIAGKAINIAQTTAGHAMCYKITTLFGCAHGHAAILCDRVLFSWMINNIDMCTDPRGEDYLKKTFDEISEAMGCDGAKAGAEKLGEIFKRLELEIPTSTKNQFEELKTSVNPDRLKNHPIALDDVTIEMLYHQILN